MQGLLGHVRPLGFAGERVLRVGMTYLQFIQGQTTAGLRGVGVLSEEGTTSVGKNPWWFAGGFGGRNVRSGQFWRGVLGDLVRGCGRHGAVRWGHLLCVQE